MLLSMPEYRKLSAKILEAQDKLQAASEIDAWIVSPCVRVMKIRLLGASRIREGTPCPTTTT